MPSDLITIQEAASVLGVADYKARPILEFHGVEGQDEPKPEGKFGKPRKLYSRTAVEAVLAKK